MKKSAALALALVAIPASARAGTVTTETHQGHQVRVFTPSATPKALVLMLHGCTQTADGFADATQIEALADTEGFVVAFPQQLDSATQRCWQWWDPANQKRGEGEPQALADTASEIVQAKGLDPERVYVAGISAGAAMTVILGVTYPDRFAAIGAVAGLEYKAATSLGGVIGASGTGGPDPGTQGDLAFAEMGALARVVPAYVIHGTSDAIVDKVNGDQIAAQWLRVDTHVLGDGAVAPVVTSKDTAGYAFTRNLYRAQADRATLVEQLVVEGLGHAWPGGKAGGSFSDPKGPDATKLLWAFFAPRTKSAALVASPDPVPGDPSSSGSSGTPVSDPAPAPSSSSSSSSSGGGCAAAPSAPTSGALVVSALAIAAAWIARRKRKA